MAFNSNDNVLWKTRPRLNYSEGGESFMGDDTKELSPVRQMIPEATKTTYIH